MPKLSASAFGLCGKVLNNINISDSLKLASDCIPAIIVLRQILNKKIDCGVGVVRILPCEKCKTHFLHYKLLLNNMHAPRLIVITCTCQR